MRLKRQLKAFVALPFMVVVIIPLIISWIAGLFLPPEYHYLPGWPLLTYLGVLCFLCGAALSAAAVTLFARLGRGTLAPWDPPRHLVVAGPYKLTRNPMITGVFGMLLGEALYFSSWPLLAWFVIFVIDNALWVPLWEEPGLVKRFGQDYLVYKNNVPRWLPRLSPWQPPWDQGQ